MEKSVKELEKIAREVRKDVVEMVYQAGSGHLAGSLSVADVLVALFFGGIIDQGKRGDRFILSVGHYCPALYSVLSRLGHFDRKLLWTLRDFGSPLQGHPHRGSLPGIELSTGALGQGLSVGVGKALALKTNQQSAHVFVLMSDGEQNEGQVWEAAMMASKYKLDNLVAIVDKNGIQGAGKTLDIMPLENLKEKYEVFGWQAKVVDGHSIRGVIESLSRLKSSSRLREEPTASAEGPTSSSRRPKVMIVQTIAGKGVSFLEGDYKWHAKPISEADCKKAMEELVD